MEYPIEDQATESGRPEWIDDTPEQVENYHLLMTVNGNWEQAIELNRREFVTLKALLAVQRGFQPEPEQAEPEAKAA